MTKNYGAARPVEIPMTDPAYADIDPTGYLLAHDVIPEPTTDYSPAQARGLVSQVQGAHARFHGKDASTIVTFVDENRPRHLRKVYAKIGTSRNTK